MEFGHELLQPDLDRISERLETAFERMPALARAGIKDRINGPFTFGPDGNPLIGPVPGLRNYWVAVGVMAGFCQGGGVGLCMAQWMVEGEPDIDVWAMDVARFGEFATRDWGSLKSAENYSRRFILTYPNEELPVGRPHKTTALYDVFKNRGAVFGQAFGLENVLWFAPPGTEPLETPTFRRSNAFEHVAEEIRCVRENLGALEIANFAKHLVTGPNAGAFLDNLFACRLPKPGRMTLAPMLSPKGRLLGDLSLACLDADTYYIFGSGAAQEMHRRWIEGHLPDNGVAYRNRSDELHGISIAGPRSRDLLSRLTGEDVSAEAFRFMDIRPMNVGLTPCLVARVSFTGELGYEIYCAPVYQRSLYEAIEREGAEIGVKWFGARALMSMRLEKNWGAWTLEYRPDFTAAESGLDRFISFKKSTEFIGRQAALSERERRPEKTLVMLELEDTGVDAIHDEPIAHNGECVGYITSGGYAHYVGRSMALGYIPTGLASTGNAFEVELLGNWIPAKLVPEPLYDPDGSKMRS